MMKRYVLSAAAIALALISSASAGQQPASTSGTPAPIAPYKATIDQYCVTCHNQRAKTAGLALDTLDLTKLPDHADIWEKAIMKLRGNLMPPPNAKQPDAAAKQSLVTWLETTLDQAAAAKPNPGSVSLHRLNRAEYSASIKELLDIDVDATTLLPADDISDGFDNISNVLKVSPAFLDQYIFAGRAIAIQAIGTPVSAESQLVTLRPGSSDQDPYIRGGIPLGMTGTVVEHAFPVDGEYEIRGVNGTLFLDGVRIAPNGRIAVKAGVHKIGVGTAPNGFVESDTMLQSFTPGLSGGGGGFGAGGRGGRGGRAAGIQIAGPFNPAGAVPETPSRERIFVCHPANESQEIPCATKIFENLERRAYRRPVSDADVAGPLEFFKK